MVPEVINKAPGTPIIKDQIVIFFQTTVRCNTERLSDILFIVIIYCLGEHLMVNYAFCKQSL